MPPGPSRAANDGEPERRGHKQRVRGGHDHPVEGVSETDPDAIGPGVGSRRRPQRSSTRLRATTRSTVAQRGPENETIAT